jgi:uncharacterized protein YggE
MKHLWLLVLCMMMPHVAQAQGVMPPQLTRNIAVTGDAEIKVVPDQVIISMTAENRGADLLQTKDKNNETVAALLDYVEKTLGVDKKNFQTDFESLEPVYRSCDYQLEMSGQCSSLEVAYYNVRKGVQIKLDDPAKYETLMTEALKMGITRIDNIQFITTELRKHRDAAREMAAKAAQEKAAALSKTLGMGLGKPISINATDYSSFYTPGHGGRMDGRMAQNVMMDASGGAMEKAGESTLALGQVTVTATVNVTFEIE